MARVGPDCAPTPKEPSIAVEAKCGNIAKMTDSRNLIQVTFLESRVVRVLTSRHSPLNVALPPLQSFASQFCLPVSSLSSESSFRNSDAMPPTAAHAAMMYQIVRKESS